MPQKDFKVKQGLIVGGNITSNTNGFVYNYAANTLSIGGSAVAYASNVNTVQSNLTSLTTSVNTIAANVNSVQSNLTSLTTSVNTIAANVNSVQSNLTSLTTSVNTIAANVNSVQTNVAAVETRATANINTVQSNVTSLTTSVNTIAANVNSVQTNVAAVETRATANINTVQSNVTSLTTSVNTIAANVNSVQSNVSSITSGATAFTGNITMQRDLTVSGNLTVGGTTTTVNSVDTVVTDRVLTLSNGAASGAFDSGLIVARGTDANVFIGFDESTDEFIAGYTTQPGGNTVTNYTFSAYANARFNNITVDGTVDGVDVSTLNTTVGGLSTNINTVQSNLTSLTTSVNTIAANVNSVQSNVTSLTTSVNTIAANVNSVQSNVASLTTSVNTIRANVDSVSSNVANIINGTTQFTGAVTFQDNITADRAILNGQLQIGSNVSTGVGTSATVVFTFPGATYRGAELLLMVQDVTNSQYQLSKMLIVHDGNIVDWTEYGVITTGTVDLTTFSAAIDGSDVITVSSTGGSANKKITVASHYLIQ